MFNTIWLVTIFYSASVSLVLRKWRAKGFGVSFVATLALMILITLLWEIPSPAEIAVLLIIYIFMLFLGGGTALLFHLIEDRGTERQYTLLISSLSVFFGGVSLLPATVIAIVLYCAVLNQCI